MDTMLQNPDQVWSAFTWYSSESWFRKRIWSSFIDVHIYGHGYIIPKEILVAKGNKIRNLSLLLTIWINIQFVSQTHLWYQAQKDTSTDSLPMRDHR